MQEESIYKDHYYELLFQDRNEGRQAIQDFKVPKVLDQSNNLNYFQSFSYTDHITNNTLLLDYSMKAQPKQKNGQRVSLKNSINLISSTRRFQLNSLKQKNYRQFNTNINGSSFCEQQEKQNRIKKYLIRKRKQKESYNREKLQLSRVLSNDKKYTHVSANTSLLNSPRHIKVQGQTIKINNQASSFICSQRIDNKQGNQDNKQKIDQNEDIIKQFQKSLIQQNQKRSKRRDKYKKRSHIKLNISQMTLEQINLVQKIDRELHRQVIKNAEYLIEPKTSKLNMIKINKSGNKIQKRDDRKGNKQLSKILSSRLKQINIFNGKNQEKKRQIFIQAPNKYKQLRIDEQLSEYRFKYQEQEQIMKKYKLIQSKQKENKIDNRFKAQQVALIQSIKQGKIHKVQLALTLIPQLINTKQKFNDNNLLHLSIKHNHPQIFMLVLKKCQLLNVDLLNLANKYKRTPAHLCKVYKAFHQKCTLLDNKQTKQIL